MCRSHVLCGFMLGGASCGIHIHMFRVTLQTTERQTYLRLNFDTSLSWDFLGSKK